MSLTVYNRKRKFNQTPEPVGKKAKRKKGELRFVVQLHRATRLHYDFRLEYGGVFRSWAVPKGPSLNPLDQRLAVFVEDHPLEYGSFEGIIPRGNYGAGTVMVWDRGTYVERGSSERKDSEIAMAKGFEEGHMTFVLDGEKLKGEFALIKLKKDENERAWLLIKKRDAHSTYKRSDQPSDLSVKTGRSMEEIAAQAEDDGDIWLPKKGKGKKAITKTPARTKISAGTETKLDPMPRRLKPMLPIVGRRFESNWILEPATEGLRAVAEVEGKRVSLYSKSHLPYEKKFPEIVASLKTLDARMVLDGTIFTSKGRSLYQVSDILYFEGHDLRDEPLEKRKKILTKAIDTNPNLKIVKELDSKKIKNGEAILAKNPKSPYRSGISTDWVQTVFEISKKKMHVSQPGSIEEPQLTNLSKIFWPAEKITKGDLLDYYKMMGPHILPHLVDRPESLNRHPNGITSGGFYQKDMTGHHPRWLKTVRIFSESADKTIDYTLCQDLRSLLYIVNLGCIEINPWFSRVENLDKPDFLVIDLDPDENPFSHVVEVALAVRDVLESIGARSYCKTSGATGIHIGVPTGARYDFDTTRTFAQSVCAIIAKKYPATTSLDRNPNRRRKKIYLDFMQNRRGQTLAAPFCVRPRAGAPVSTPLAWEELTSKLRPEQFNLRNSFSRVQKVGDLWRPVLGKPIDLEACVKQLQRKYPSDSLRNTWQNKP